MRCVQGKGDTVAAIMARVEMTPHQQASPQGNESNWSAWKRTSAIAKAGNGTWPKHCEQRAFVDGAKWWQFHNNGATAFPSERDEMEAEAVRRYGDPL
jgi:hypothetical protein